MDLATGEVIRLITGLHRLGGIAYYEPGNVLIVGEEGTGLGPEEFKRGFWYAILPDVPDQDIPPPLRAMGQYRAEGIEPVSADTIYLGEDQPHGGPIYRYILDSPPDLTKGTLYVFKEDEGWIETEHLEAPDTGKEGTNFFAGEDMHIGPDGKLYMVISAQAENKVVAIDTVTAEVTDFVIAKEAKGFERPDQLAFSPNGVLFITASGEVWAALPDGPDDDTLSDGVYRFLKDLDMVLDNHKMDKKKTRIGIDIVESQIVLALLEGGYNIADGQGVMQYARSIKNEDEIMCLKHGAAIVDGAFHRIAQTIAPGIKENDLQAAASHEMHRLGAQWVHNVQVTTGNRTHPHPHLSSDRLIQPGDMIFMDIVMMYNGYHTCVYRCFCCGKPNQKQKDIHQRCLDYQLAGIEAVKPGLTSADQLVRVEAELE